MNFEIFDNTSPWVFLAQLFSSMGGQTFNMALLCVGYWCIHRKFFRNLTVMVLLTAMLNIVLKSIFQIPRPSTEHLAAVEYNMSFPSGHAQIAAVIWLMIGMHFKRRSVWALSILMITGIGISRVALGVHYMNDVVWGTIIGALSVVLYTLYTQSKAWRYFGKRPTYGLALCILFLAIYYTYMSELIMRTNAYSGGGLLGLMLSVYLFSRWQGRAIPNGIKNRITLGLFGLINVFALQYGLSIMGPGAFNAPYVFASYCLIALFSLVLVPILYDRIFRFRHLKPLTT